ncbi:MAG: hypothetical protein WCW33_04825 [Candidatus Babeliales bacterium]|jgi:hypothetical protein
MKLQKSIFLWVISIVLCTGCARYEAQPLAKAGLATHEKKPTSYRCAYHVFTKDDCKRYLGRNVVAKGYQPILITFTNNTKRYFRVLRENISMPTIPASQVVRRVHTSTVGRSLGYGIAGLIVWPLLIPAIVDGIRSSQANYKLDRDFASKELADQVVGPFVTLDGLIFVPKEKFSWNFTIKIIDAETEEVLTLKSHPASGELSE